MLRSWKSRVGRLLQARVAPDTAILVTACLLRLLFLAAKSPGFDESKTLLIAISPLSESVRLVHAVEASPPLYFLLSSLWARLFADALFGIRLFSALFGIGALFLFRNLCRRLMPRAMLWPFALGCFSSMWLHAAQDGRCYSLLLCLGLAQTLAALDVVESADSGKRLRALARYSILSLFALFTHFFGVVALAAHGGFLLFNARRQRQPLALILISHILLGGAVLFWMFSHPETALTHAESGFTDRLGLVSGLRALGTMLFNISYLEFRIGDSVSWLGAGVLAVAAWGARDALRAAKQGDGSRAFCLYHVAAPFLIVAGIETVITIPFVQPRYFILLSPFLFCILADTIVRVRRSIPRRIGIAVLGGVIVAGLLGYFTSNILFDPRIRLWSGVLRRHVDKRDTIVYLNTYYYLSMREYFLPERPQVLYDVDPSEIDWSVLSRYPAFVSGQRLKRPGQCAVVDPSRRLGGRMLSLMPCAALERRLAGETLKRRPPRSR